MYELTMIELLYHSKIIILSLRNIEQLEVGLGFDGYDGASAAF